MIYVALKNSCQIPENPRIEDMMHQSDLGHEVKKLGAWEGYSGIVETFPQCNANKSLPLGELVNILRLELKKIVEYRFSTSCLTEYT